MGRRLLVKQNTCKLVLKMWAEKPDVEIYQTYSDSIICIALIDKLLDMAKHSKENEEQKVLS